jgi:predicted RNase H-like HicB family nuclease
LREEAFHELEEFLTLCEELLINPGEAPGEPKATDSRPL